MHFVNGWFDFYQVSFINEETFGFAYTFASAHVSWLMRAVLGQYTAAPAFTHPHTCTHMSIKHIY